MNQYSENLEIESLGTNQNLVGQYKHIICLCWGGENYIPLKTFLSRQKGLIKLSLNDVTGLQPVLFVPGAEPGIAGVVGSLSGPSGS